MAEEHDRSLHRRLVKKARRAAYAALGRTRLGTVVSVATNQPLVALTFDDGPDERWTPMVLDVLASRGAKATFFVVGERAAQHPEVLGRMHSEGHALGNHTHHHRSLGLIGRAERRREIRSCAQVLTAFPQRHRLLRPPHLDQTLASRVDAWTLGYDVIACNRHARDWEERSSHDMVHELSDGLSAGDIVMLHDSLFDQHQRSRAAMIEALDAVLRVQTSRFGFVTVPDLLAAGRPRREMWIKHPSAERRAVPGLAT